MEASKQQSVTFHTSNQRIEIHCLPKNHIKLLEELSKLKADETATQEEKREKLKQILG